MRLSHASAALYARSFIFGVEDSLVSTVGLLAGVASAAVDRRTILVTGVVLIAVEALSMGVGSFLAEKSTEEYGENRRHARQRSALGGAIMFGSYLVAGLIPLGPYLLADTSSAFALSIAASLVALAILGIISGLALKLNVTKQVARIVTLGGLATAVGVAVGRLVS
jgi:VIT1/CCC1 family predicted Fe2+/Mn2+ transporter